MEDEWLIVYLLRELTRQLPTLWVRVSDTDGEFLLVEAAKVLPPWITPENDANRAWLHSGQLRLIPLQPGGDAPPNKITLPQAVRLLRTAPDSLIHSPFIEAEALYRLEKYPGQILNSLHYAMVSVPRRLAYVLHELPRTIAPAVESFYLRDPIALKPLMAPATESLFFPPNDLTQLSVKFTKVLYAQLKSQHFAPPPSWQALFTAAEKETVSSGALVSIDLGMKVTCGFEMLAMRAAKSNNRTAREFAVLLDDLVEDGDSELPSNADIASWTDSAREDDDAWMNINFEDFEKELDGRKDAKGEFGDTNTRADLRKIVSRFETFLNDDRAGVDGAELHEMDQDDDESDSDSEAEDCDVSFDEAEFSRMMREMMGMPTGSAPASNKSREARTAPGPDTLEMDDSEDEEIKKLSAQMAAELHDHGALALDPTPKKVKASDSEGYERAEALDDEENENDQVDIDYNLVSNLLESFKSQNGLSGPVGTMLADMGMQLPRDEGDEEEDVSENR